MKIALDAMGGDFGPPNLVGGATLALREYSQIKKLYLVGDTPKIEAELTKLGCTDNRVEIVHATQVVDMSDRAWSAVRRKKDSSVSRAVDVVKHGQAIAIVSAGHTGAAGGRVKERQSQCNRQCWSYWCGRSGEHDQAANVAGNRSAGYRRSPAHGNERFCLNGRGRKYRCPAGASASICIHGIGLFQSCSWLQEPNRWINLIGGRGCEGKRDDKGSFQDAEEELVELCWQHRGPAFVRRSSRGGGVRWICRQRDFKNVRIDLSSHFSMAETRAVAHNHAKVRRISGPGIVSHHSRQDTLRRIRRESPSRRQRHLHNRARLQFAARNQKRIARCGRID